MSADPFIDTHVHVASLDTDRYPRRPSGVGSLWWTEARGTADAVLAAATAAGAQHVVVVQAVGAYGNDSSCALDVVTAQPELTSFVAAPDMSAADPTASLTAEIASGHLSGVRMFGVADGAPWLDDARADAVMQLCAAHDITAVPTIFSDRLAALRRVAKRHPDVAIALDHCGFPDMAGAAGEQALLVLADLPSVHLKVSSHVLTAWRAEDRLQTTVERLVAEFGATRLCWGSDHPQHAGTYQHCVDLARDAVARLSGADRHEFFVGTATRLGWG